MTEQGFSFDDYLPADMAKRVNTACVSKTKLCFLSLSMLSILVGNERLHALTKFIIACSILSVCVLKMGINI